MSHQNHSVAGVHFRYGKSVLISSTDTIEHRCDMAQRKTFYGKSVYIRDQNGTRSASARFSAHLARGASRIRLRVAALRFFPFRPVAGSDDPPMVLSAGSIPPSICPRASSARSIAAFCFSIAGYATGNMKYCDLVVYRPAFKNYVAEMHVDSNTRAQASVLRDGKGNKIKFASAADALNYMAKQGWELVAAYDERGGGIHFILKK